MNVQHNGIYDLLKQLEIIFEKGFPILPGYLVAIKTKEVEDILDSIYGSLPQEIQEARRLLRRKEELQIEAQQKAEKIVLDAQNEANRLLSDSEMMKQVTNRAELLKEQVITECEEIKHKAMEDAENYRNQAHDDAMRKKEGADAYVDQVLTSLDNNLNQLQQSVKSAQIYMEKLRSESAGGYDPLRQNYPQQEQPQNDNFKI